MKQGLRKYEEAHDEFLRRNAGELDITELTKAFNDSFGTNVTTNGIACHCHNIGVRILTKRYHHFTEDEMEWVKEQYLSGRKSNAEIASEFNDRFKPTDKTLNHQNVNDLMVRKLKVKRGYNRGQFGRGVNNPRQHSPIGTVMGAWKSGSHNKGKYYRVKVGAFKFNETDSPYKANYMMYHTYLYEQAHGKLKEGEFVIFADGNTQNLDLDNLVKVDRRIQAYLAKHKWHGLGKVTKAAVEMIRAECQINDRFGKGGKQ